MASAILQEISKDEKERAILRSQKKYEMDMYSNMMVLQRMEKQVEIRERKKWETVVAEKNKELTDSKAEIARLRSQIAES